MPTLITGAGGFIGLNATEHLLAAGHDVVAFDIRPLHPAASRVFGLLPGRLAVETGDIRDYAVLKDVLRRHAVRRILHTAAVTSGPCADPVRATTVIDVNVAGTNAVLMAARTSDLQRVVLTSSSAIYGEAPFGTEPVTEDTPPRPVTLYAHSKLAAERLGRQLRQAHGLDVVCGRLTAIYGAWEHDTDVRDTLSPPLQIAAAALAGEPVVLADGGRRDWTPGPEIGHALVLLLEAPTTRHDLYNLGCGQAWHPALLCQAFEDKAKPGWTWRNASLGEMPSIVYNDTLDRPRLSPPSSNRFVQEFGPVFREPAEDAGDYAAWASVHRPSIGRTD